MRSGPSTLFSPFAPLIKKYLTFFLTKVTLRPGWQHCWSYPTYGSGLLSKKWKRGKRMYKVEEKIKRIKKKFFFAKMIFLYYVKLKFGLLARQWNLCFLYVDVCVFVNQSALSSAPVWGYYATLSVTASFTFFSSSSPTLFSSLFTFLLFFIAPPLLPNGNCGAFAYVTNNRVLGRPHQSIFLFWLWTFFYIFF